MNTFNMCCTFSRFMKRSFFVSLVAALLTPTLRAETPSLYGVVDTGIEFVNHVASAGGGVTRMPTNTGLTPSRLGIRGNEELGSSLEALYNLEMGFGPDTGSSAQGGRLFGRQSFVGLGSEWGTITVGRQWTMLFWALLDADIVGPAIYGTGSLDSYLPNARVDNSVAYQGKFRQYTVGATYSLGRDTVNAGPSPAGTNCPGESGVDPQACREWSLMVKYDTPTWGAALAYDTMNGRTPVAAFDMVFAGLTASSKSDTRLVIDAYARIDRWKVSGGIIHRHNDGNATHAESDLCFVAASYPVSSALTIEGTLASLNFQQTNNANARLLTVRMIKELSKGTRIYAQLGIIQNESQSGLSVSGGGPTSAPSLSDSQVGTMIGISQLF